MNDKPMQAVDMAGEFGAELRLRAAVLIEEAKRVSAVLSPAPDAEVEVRVNSVGHALQAIFAEARNAGVNDHEVFMALAGSLGWVACQQELGSPGVWLDELRRRSGVAINMALATGVIEAVAIHPTAGNA